MSITDRFIEAVRALPSRGDSHVFLGHPASDACDKTTVEPGNGYSPGVWTCGIYVWLEIDGKLYTPDMLERSRLQWGFGEAGGLPPVLETAYQAGPVGVRHRLAHLGGEGAEGADFSEVNVTASAAARAAMYLVVHDVGPAGAKILSIEQTDGPALLVNSRLRVSWDRIASDVRIVSADGTHDSLLAVVRFDVQCQAGEAWTLRFKSEHGFGPAGFGEHVPIARPYARTAVEDAMAQASAQWEPAVPAKLFCPDERVNRVFQRSAFHILSAMECKLPRIGAVNYPVFWIRDCVIVLRALDVMGRGDLARIGNEYLAKLDFSGGFGAEGDAPGEGIWSLVNHCAMTGDQTLLKEFFPHIRRRIDWLEKMTSTATPLRAMTENRLPAYQSSPGINMICLASQHGLVQGRMDWHLPVFFINCWACVGYRCAAEAAARLGQADLFDRWRERARQIEQAIGEHLLPDYLSNDRNPIVTPYPTGALADDAALAEKFAAWYRRNRLSSDGKRKREPLWTYFEAAQIHNAFLLGLRDEAWINLDGMLDDGPWDVSAFIEGPPSGNEYLPFGNGVGRRGWLHPRTAEGGNMPHNWTSGEMVNLLRDMFVREQGGELVLGLGIRPEWLKPGSKFGVKDMPTSLGKVSYRVTIGPDGGRDVQYWGSAKYRLGF